MPTDDTLRPSAPILAEGRATIADVARLAGVSKATVSRFLNHRDTLLSPGIATRVEAAVDQLGYVPSPMAQALKRGRSRLIGLVVADISNPFSVAVLRGAEKACQEAGYLVMLFNLGNDSAREREGIEALASYQVEGFILNTLGTDPKAADEVARHGKPAVLVDRKHPEMQADFVSLDNADAMRQAVTHLLERGYRELLYVTEATAGVSSRQEREAAFTAHLAANVAAYPAARSTLQPAIQSVAQSAVHPASQSAVQAPTASEPASMAPSGRVVESTDVHGADLQAHLLGLRARVGPAAVIASNAVTTLRVATACAALGWTLGHELGFVGIDETEWAPLVGPGLTTIAQPTDDIGRVAASCLLDHLQGRKLPPRQILLPGRLVVRGSSQAVAVPPPGTTT